MIGRDCDFLRSPPLRVYGGVTFAGWGVKCGVCLAELRYGLIYAFMVVGGGRTEPQEWG